MNKIILIASSILLTISQLTAQTTTAPAPTTGVMTFAETKFDFGTVKEENGKVSHKFMFTNTGTQPLKIDTVTASCGCTTPNWSKETIKPGGQGFIIAEFDPTNRPGKFDKSVTVKSSSSNPQYATLFFSGVVTPRPKTVADTLRDKYGNLRMESRGMYLDKVQAFGTVTKEFQIYNDGDTVINFAEPKVSQQHLKVQIVPMDLKPKQRGKIIVTYDPVLKGDYGFVSDYIDIISNDKVDGVKKMTVSAMIEPYCPPTTTGKTPSITFDKVNHDFADVKEGETVTTNFVITNNGTDTLRLLKVKASCGCTATNPEKYVLGPGESTNIKVSFSPRGAGSQSKTVSVYSNDCKNSNQTLGIKANVIKPTQ